MPLPVRPFPAVILDRGPEAPGLSLQGIVRPGAYVLALGDAEIVVPTVSCGQDEHGPVCFVAEGLTDVSGGLTLEVMEEDGIQAEILLYRTPPAAPLAATRNVVMPRHTIVSINFHPDGRYEAASSPRRIPSQPPIQH